MLFNPQAKRFTFRDLRALAVMTDPALKKQLDANTKAREFAEHVYSQCRQTEEDQRLFNKEMVTLNSRSDAILKAAYEHMRRELAAETLYGFGTKPPVTPQSAIDIIPPHYWLFLQLKPETSEVFGHGVHYVGVFFQRKEDVPPETIALIKKKQSNPSTMAPEVNEPAESPKKTKAEANYYISPFILLQQDATRHFNIDPANPPYKDAVMEWITAEAQKRGLDLSRSAIEKMATFVRNPESQKGGNRTVPAKKMGETVA